MSVEEALVIIKNEVKEVSRDGKRTLKLKCTSSYNANRMIIVYGAIYGYNNVSDAGFHFLNTDKYAYPMFADTMQREEAFALTQDLIDGKEVSVNTGSVTVNGGNSGNQTTTTVIAADPEDNKKKSFLDNYATYVIIGVAAAIILLLLWDKKKK